MNDKTMTVGEALEVVCRYARTHQRTSPELQAALAAFDGWGEPITEEWLDGLGAERRHGHWSDWWVIYCGGGTFVEVANEGERTQFQSYVGIAGYIGHTVSDKVGSLRTRGDLLGLLHFLGVEL